MLVAALAASVLAVYGAVTTSRNDPPPPAEVDLFGPPRAVQPGDRMVEIQGTNYNEETVAITDDGKEKLIVFVGTVCPRCQEELIALNNWSRGGGRENINIYLVVPPALFGSRTDTSRELYEPLGFSIVRDDRERNSLNAYKLPGLTNQQGSQGLYLVGINTEGNVIALQPASGGPQNMAAQLDAMFGPPSEQPTEREERLSPERPFDDDTPLPPAP